MSDYFDHVERSLREACAARRQLPWLARLGWRGPAPGAGRGRRRARGRHGARGNRRAADRSAGQRRSARGTEAGEGTVIASCVHVLPLRVADPAGRPAWGCAWPEPLVACCACNRAGRGRAGGSPRPRRGVQGRQSFHPFSSGYLSGLGCATQDGRGDGFLNVQVTGSRQRPARQPPLASGGCYAAPLRPRPARRGNCATCTSDARSGRHHDHRARLAWRQGVVRGGARPTGPTSSCSRIESPVAYREWCSARRDGARLHLLPHPPSTKPSRPSTTAMPHRASCAHQAKPGAAGTGAGSLLPRRRIRPTQAGRSGQVTSAQLASPVTVHLQQAGATANGAASLIACEGAVPRGYKRLRMIGPPERLLVVDFTAREAVTELRQSLRDRNLDPRGSSAPGISGSLWRDVRAHPDAI